MITDTVLNTEVGMPAVCKQCWATMDLNEIVRHVFASIQQAGEATGLVNNNNIGLLVILFI